VKTTKNKKKSKADAVSESVPVTLEESRVEAQTKPKKQSKKDKVVVAEEAPTAEEQKPEAPAEKPKKAKKGKKADSAPSAPEEEDVAAGAQEEAPSKKSKKAKGSKKQEEPVEEVTDVALTEVNGDGDVEEDDQTAALLAGFESDDEDEDPEHDVDFEDDVTVPNISKKARKELENAAKGSNANQPGVIYVGYVSHTLCDCVKIDVD
jgi:nucleolar protein 15